jgi:chromate transporter
MPQIPLFLLFRAFFRIGLTAFGGPAMIPHIRKLAVDTRGWLTEADFKTGLAVCQAIPGATVVQLAAYVGLRLRGLAGAVVAFVAFASPAFLLITMLSALYFRFQNLPRLLTAFDGLKALVVAIVLSAALDFLIKYVRETRDKVLALGAALAFTAQIHPVLILICVAVAGLCILPPPGTAHPKTARGANLGAAIRLTGYLGLGYALLWLLRPDLFRLAAVMMGIDLVAFGGGFAALPVMLHEVVIRMDWMNQAVFMDGIALGQITPGPIVLTSAFVGFAQAGLLGAMAGALGIFTPSLLLLVWTVPVCDRLLGSRLFRKALRASLASLGGLMVAVATTLGAGQDWGLDSALLALAAFVALRRNLDILWVVLGGAGLWMLLAG